MTLYIPTPSHSNAINQFLIFIFKFVTYCDFHGIFIGFPFHFYWKSNYHDYRAWSWSWCVQILHCLWGAIAALFFSLVSMIYDIFCCLRQLISVYFLVIFVFIEPKKLSKCIWQQLGGATVFSLLYAQRRHGLKKLGNLEIGIWNFPSDSCKFPTKKIRCSEF